MTSFVLQSLLLLAATAVASAASHPPSTGQEWMSLKEGVEFQPASVEEAPREKQRALQDAQERFLENNGNNNNNNQYTSQGKQLSYVDSSETYYDGYAQAWRYVGFYTDCNPQQDDHRRARHGRRAQKKKNGLFGGNGNDNSRQLNGEEEDGCVRYLLWAAYVDLDYTGKGIGEYQFFDTYTKEWDASACDAMGTDEADCKKCDCHMADTNWQLLGYFKEVEYTEWFEQLFKHLGYCVWQQNEYDFMYENYDAWPEGCEDTEIYLSDGSSLYTDTKAEANGTMTYGLYTDARCSVDYTGDEVTVQSLLSSGDDNDALSWDNLQYWNEAMEIYRVCQPCRAYDLNGNSNNRDRQRRRLDDDPNGGMFQCDDAAGYSNVNQCMKFATQTDMEYASLEEVMEAALQGGVTSVTVNGLTYGSYREGVDLAAETPNWQLLWIACHVLGAGLITILSAVLYSNYRHRRAGPKTKKLKQPLIQHFSM